MDKINQKNLDIMNYIILFSDRNVTEEIRNAAKTYFSSFEKYREMFNDMIFITRNKISSVEGSSIFNEIFNYLKTEYIALDFNQFINFDYIERLLFLSLRLSAVNGYSYDKIWQDINIIMQAINNCDNQKLKDEVYYICTTIVSNYNIAAYDIESTENLLSHCREIDFDNFRIEVLPNAILMT